jgi:hypothetical protein
MDKKLFLLAFLTACFAIAQAQSNSGTTISNSSTNGASDKIPCTPPATYTLNTSASGFCPGGSVTFSLSGTQVGVSYQLYRNGTAAGSVLTGTGSAATFTVPTDHGSYTAKAVASNGYCDLAMAGSKTVVALQAPSAPEISHPDNVCEGTELIFTASNYTGTLDWTGTEGAVANGANYTYPATAAEGAKTVSVTQTITTGDVACTSAAATATAYSNIAPVVPILTTPTAVCEGSNLIFSVTGTPGSTFDWSGSTPGGTRPEDDSTTTTYTYMSVAAGTITVNVKASIAINGITCTSEAATGSVTVVAIPPAPTITAPAAVCAGTELTFIASGYTGKLDWTGTEGATIDGASYTYPATATVGPKTIAVTQTVIAGGIVCTSAAAATTAHIITQPAVPTLQTPPDALCAGSSLVFNASGTPNSIFEWNGSTAGGTPSGAHSTTYTYASATAGTTTVNVKASIQINGVACTSDAATGSVTVNAPSVIELTAGTATQTVCAGTAITNEYTLSGSADSYTISNLPAGLTHTFVADLKKITISGSPTASGTYTIITKGHTPPCTADTITGSVTVTAIPATPTLTTPDAVCAGTELIFTASGHADTGTWNWDGSTDGAAASGANYIYPATATAGAKTVAVTQTVLTDGVACTSDAATTTAYITPLPAKPMINTPDTVCIGSNLVFIAKSTEGSTFEWNGSPGGTPSGNGNATCTYVATEAGTIVVVVSASITANGITCTSGMAAGSGMVNESCPEIDSHKKSVVSNQ